MWGGRWDGLAGGSRDVRLWCSGGSQLSCEWNRLSSTEPLVPLRCYGFPDELQLLH